MRRSLPRIPSPPALAALAALAACSPPPPPPAPPSFTGRAACTECHPREAAAYAGSHHDLAIQPATPATVLGDFDDATLEHSGTLSRFHRDGDRFLVTTAGPDGRAQDFEIAYTFGADPLQQYLVAFPGGRSQALPLCWDARPADAGGQRWFHLYPNEPLPPGDPLHWTGPNQNWNHVCAACHSTDLRKGYDPVTGNFATTWSELDVSCEACHGPGSAHEAWARARGTTPLRPGEDPLLPAQLGDRDGGWWGYAGGAPTADRRPPRTALPELDVCAPCHSRRDALAEWRPGQAFLDAFRPALLADGLYHADGQIRDEVYVWGSFQQSRMFQAGVTCSDCHDPHSLQPRAPGDALCATCHAPASFQVRSHHFHDPARAGASCIDCHMPATVYMGVDERHDHSFRVPRPDLTLALGSPNTCTGCHAQEGATWAAARMDEWYGPAWRKPHFGTQLAAARRGAEDAGPRLAALATDSALPPLVRATALAELRWHPSPEALDAATRGAADPAPLVRLGAIEALADWPARLALPALFPLLDDPLRAVRIEAARLAAGHFAVASGPAGAWPGARAAAELEASFALDADRADGRVARGQWRRALGDRAGAELEHRAAVALDPSSVRAAVNLADLLRERGADAEAERVLRALLARVPDAAAAHHALGLALVRLGRPEEALAELRRAVADAPEVARYRYVLGVALRDLGHPDDEPDQR